MCTLKCKSNPLNSLQYVHGDYHAKDRQEKCVKKMKLNFDLFAKDLLTPDS